MKALVLQEPGRFSLAEVDRPPAPRPGEALVRVRRIGICGTDLHAFEGRQTFFRYPRILGHELSVEVLAVGDGDTRLRPGDRCAVEPYLDCGRCSACRRGRPNCCLQLSVLGVHEDGGMQELLLVPARKLHPSRHLSLDQLALVETLSVGAHAVARAAPQKDESALVIGTGPIGLSVLVAARSAGARVLALEVSDRRIAFCRDALGVDACLKPGEGAADRIRDLLAGELPAVVFDCTGNPGSMTAAFGYVEHGGRLVFVGHFPGDITFHDPDFHKGELTLLATRNATAVEFGRVVLLLEEGAVDVRPWMTDCVALERVPEVFPGWLDRDVGALKPMIALG